MIDETAFLTALKNTPTDHTTRLVYADWLDEHDKPLSGALQRVLAQPESDELRLAYADVCDRRFTLSGVGKSLKAKTLKDRAEFIRVQCELVKLSPAPLVLVPNRIEVVVPDSFFSTARFRQAKVYRDSACQFRVWCEVDQWRSRRGDVIDFRLTRLTGEKQLLLGAVIEDVKMQLGNRHVELLVSGDRDYYPDRERRTKLTDRERELLTGAPDGQELPNRVQWFGGEPWPSHTHYGRFEPVMYRRGFVTEVTCSAADWTEHGNTVRAAHPATQVVLTTRWPNGADLSPQWPGITFIMPD